MPELATGKEWIGSGDIAVPVPGVELAHVVVPLDGSQDALRAVPVARQLAVLLDAQLTFVAVATTNEGREDLQRAVERTAAVVGGEALFVDAGDVPGAILAATGTLPHRVVCMASHGRTRSAGAVHSVAAGVVARCSEPLLLVGPHVPLRHRFAGRLAVCVDGSQRSEQVLPTAASWAAALGLRLSIVTVAEPIPAPVAPGAPYRRRHGPAVVAQDYIEGLVERWERRGLVVDGDVVYHPVSVVEGLKDHLSARPPALVALTTHARTGMLRLALGSVAAGVVRHAPAPVLVVRERA